MTNKLAWAGYGDKGREEGGEHHVSQIPGIHSFQPDEEGLVTRGQRMASCHQPTIKFPCFPDGGGGKTMGADEDADARWTNLPTTLSAEQSWGSGGVADRDGVAV